MALIFVDGSKVGVMTKALKTKSRGKKWFWPLGMLCRNPDKNVEKQMSCTFQNPVVLFKKKKKKETSFVVGAFKKNLEIELEVYMHCC